MKEIPLFFQDTALRKDTELALNDDTTRHIVQVLRMQPGEAVSLTDGNGSVASGVIASAGKKTCVVRIHEVIQHKAPAPALHLAIAFTRNTSRNEWLLEKATELGVRHITPLITARSARERIRADRWQGILVSAMIQSQQYFLPVLNAPLAVPDLLKDISASQKLIAHCIPGDKTSITKMLKPGADTFILIGPEGDFTPEEVTLAMDAGCLPVSLGATRLRTETAALAACTYFHLINDPTT